MSEKITVRPALAEDKDAILAFCQNTFSWGDYIPDCWDNWLGDTRARMLVAVVDGHQVGLMHVQLLEDSVAWIEGVRVHPSFRRRGVASALNAAGRAYADHEGCKVLRLATGMDNIASQNLFGTHGYIRIASYGEWLAKPTHENSVPVHVATDGDLRQLVDQWRQVSHTLVISNPEWRWEELSKAMLGKLIRSGELRVLLNGFAILRQSQDSGLFLHALVGNEDTMYKLAIAARAEAGYRGIEHIEALIVDDDAINRALDSAGFRREGGIFVYEQALR